MSKAIIGILDYGAGNTASVRNTVSTLGFRSQLIDSADSLHAVSLLLIPGVGAFASAMQALNRLQMPEAILAFAQQGQGIIGVCLGMQLLADISYEQGITRGLSLIPGEVRPIAQPRWHIGWNSLETTDPDQWLAPSNGDSFYFNHAYEFCAPSEYLAGVARVGRPIAAMVKKDNVYGFQFHPEKSQQAGLKLMKHTIEGLLHA